VGRHSEEDGQPPSKAKAQKAPKFTTGKEQQKDLSLLQKCDEAELEDLEDDLDDDPFLEEYRRRRLAELWQTKRQVRQSDRNQGERFYLRSTDASESS